MPKPKTNPTPRPQMGRPTLFEKPMQRVLVSLPESVVEELRREGDGYISVGLRKRLGITPK